jgi:hypothetical protein
MSELNTTTVIVIRGEECRFDPVLNIAVIPCENCAHENEVEIDIKHGQPVFMGFVCEKCGHYNGPA